MLPTKIFFLIFNAVNFPHFHVYLQKHICCAHSIQWMLWLLMETNWRRFFSIQFLFFLYFPPCASPRLLSIFPSLRRVVAKVPIKCKLSAQCYSLELKRWKTSFKLTLMINQFPRAICWQSLKEKSKISDSYCLFCVLDLIIKYLASSDWTAVQFHR